MEDLHTHTQEMIGHVVILQRLITWSWWWSLFCFSLYLRKDVSITCMLLWTFTNSPFQSSMLYHKLTNRSCTFYLLSSNCLKLNLLMSWRSCLYSIKFSTSLISSLMKGFLERTDYPLPTCPKVCTSNGAK